MNLVVGFYDRLMAMYNDRSPKDKGPNKNDPQMSMLTGKSPHMQNVEAFMYQIPQPVRPIPTVPSDGERLLRAKLQLEECLELIKALGVAVMVNDNKGNSHELDENDISLELSGSPDLVAIVDGCCDSHVIATGTLIACGVADSGVQAAVDSHNLKKFGPGGYRRADGKWIKPENWIAPPLELLLKFQGWTGSNKPADL